MNFQPKPPSGDDSEPEKSSLEPPAHQPVFNLPPSVSWFALLLLAIFTAYSFALDDDGQLQLAIWLGFLPIRLIESSVPGGYWALIWTPFTHALLHGSWAHVIMNVAWLAIFGTPVARRYGAVKFLLVFFLGSAIGALAFTLLNWGDLAILVGASGGIAGLTGVATRFIFQPVQIAKNPQTGAPIVLGRRLAGLLEVFTNPRSRFFTLFWIGINLAIPIYESVTGAEGMQIAWQAHIGGFLAGLLLAPPLERRQN